MPSQGTGHVQSEDMALVRGTTHIGCMPRAVARPDRRPGRGSAATGRAARPPAAPAAPCLCAYGVRGVLLGECGGVFGAWVGSGVRVCGVLRWCCACLVLLAAWLR